MEIFEHVSRNHSRPLVGYGLTVVAAAVAQLWFTPRALRSLASERTASASVLLVSLWVLGGFLAALSKVLVNQLEPELIATTRSFLYARILRSDCAHLTPTALNSAMGHVPVRYYRLYLMWLQQALPAAVAVLTAVVALTVLHCAVGAALFLGIVLVGCVAYATAPAVYSEAHVVESAWNVQQDAYANRFANLHNLFTHDVASAELQHHAERYGRYNAAYSGLMRCATRTYVACAAAAVFSITIAFAAAYALYKRAKLSSERFADAAFTLAFVVYALYGGLDGVATTAQILGFADSESSKLDACALRPSGAEEAALSPQQHRSLQATAVTLQLPGASEPLVRDFSLELKRGDRVALLGKSGSGKSTLARVLASLQTPQSGTLTLDGHVYSSRNWVQAVYLLEHPPAPLLEATVFENIQFLRPEVTLERVRELLDGYCLDVFDSLPLGLHTLVGSRGATLSAGQTKLVGLLRALALPFQFYVFDEPLSGLDRATRERVVAMLREETRTSAALFVTHEPEILPLCTRVVQLQDMPPGPAPAVL